MGRRLSTGIGGSSNLGNTYITGSELSPTQANANLTFSPNGTGNVVVEVPNNTTRATFTNAGLTLVGTGTFPGIAFPYDGTASGIKTIVEPIATAISGATGTVVHDYSSASIFWHTSMAASFTANFTNVPTTDNRNYNFTLVLVQNGTGRYPSAVQVGGSAVTLRWASNVTPTPTATNGAIDIVSFSLFRQSATWYCVGTLSPFA
jgi:hypothetical protein